MPRTAWVFEGVWLVFWTAASSVWCVTASARIGATFDEPFYLAAGLDAWHTGSSKRLLDAGTMPLPVHAATLPIYVWERLRGQPFDLPADLDRILPVARGGTLLFWWLLLGYGWAAGRQIGGRWGGRLAVAFLACEPNLLAHASLATTDVALTACLLPLFVHFRAGRDCAWWRRVGLPAIWFAVAILAKASALAFGVIGLATLEVLRQARAAEGKHPIRAGFAALRDRRFRRDLAQTGAIALTLVFVYCGSDWRASPSFVDWARQLPEGWMGSVMVCLAEHLRIFSNAGMALARQFRHNIQGHGVFLLGMTAPRAIWYYFPVALAVKVSLPLLLLPAGVAILSPRSVRNWAFALGAAFLLFSLTFRVQIGVRLVLPLIALAAIGSAAALARALESLPSGWRWRTLGGGAIVGLTWAVWSATSVWPNALCYANELWGGPANGYRYLSDSNYDWGQGIHELATWHRGHREAVLNVWYYGTDPDAHRLKADFFDAGSLTSGRPEDFRARFQGRYLAVSTTLVYGSLFTEGFPKALVRFLKKQLPAGRTSTFLIYDFRAASESTKALAGR